MRKIYYFRCLGQVVPASSACTRSKIFLREDTKKITPDSIPNPKFTGLSVARLFYLSNVTPSLDLRATLFNQNFAVYDEGFVLLVP